MEPETFPTHQLLADVQPLKLFNKQKMVADLWKLTQDQILAFFEEINKNQQTYGIKDDAVKTKLPDVVKRINDIVKAAQVPAQGPLFLQPTMDLPFLGITKNLEVRNLYDLIGWIFSVAAGQTDKTADRNNYYFPIICVFCVFCRRLTENKKVPGKDTVLDYDPTMTQITWFNNPDDNQTYFCISANLDCATDSCRSVYGNTKRTVQVQRGEQLKGLGIIANNVNLQLVPDGGANKYGMCAETVPFLFIKNVMNRKTTVPFKRELVGGFALNGKKFLPEQPGQPVDAYGTDSIKKKEALRDPCDTCGLLITHPSLNFPPSNFKINF